jgi:hypothetical protein
MRKFKSIAEIKELYKKGTYITIVLETPREVYKKFQGEISVVKKSTFASARLGMDYDNLKEVIAKRESGALPKKNAGLPWGQWANNSKGFPYHIEHNGKDYIRVYGDKSKVTNQWFVNGVEVSKSEAFEYLTANGKGSNKPIEGNILTMSPKLENVKNIEPENGIEIKVNKTKKELTI